MEIEIYNLMPPAWCFTCAFATSTEEFPSALVEHANRAHAQHDGAHEANWVSDETGNFIEWNDKGRPIDGTTKERLAL